MFEKHLFSGTSPVISKTDTYLGTIAKKRNDFDARVRQYTTTIKQISLNGLPTAAVYDKHVIVHRLIMQLRDNISNCLPDGHGVLKATSMNRRLTKAEISSQLNVVRILSLSNDMAEIVHGVIDKNSPMTEREFTTKVARLARKAHYLPGYGNDLFIKISTELARLAIAYVCLSVYLFLYAAISHAALIAATAFLGIALTLLGICIGLRYLNKKTNIVDNLLCIIDHLKYHDLKFDGERFEDGMSPIQITPGEDDNENICRYTESGHFTSSTMDVIRELLGDYLPNSSVFQGQTNNFTSSLNWPQINSENVSSASSDTDEPGFVMVPAGDQNHYDFVLSAHPNYSPDYFSTPESGGSPTHPVNLDEEVSSVSSHGSQADGEDGVMVGLSNCQLNNYDFGDDKSLSTIAKSGSCLSSPPDYSFDFFSSKSSSPVHNPDTEYELVGGPRTASR